MRAFRFQTKDERIKEKFRDIKPGEVPKELSWNPTKLRYRNKNPHRFNQYFRSSASSFIQKPAVREYVFNKYDCCGRCGTEDNLQIDHIVAVVYAYPSIAHLINHIDNLRLLCISCNSSEIGRDIEHLRIIHSHE